jgi:hypothetical protein
MQGHATEKMQQPKLQEMLSIPSSSTRAGSIHGEELVQTLDQATIE